MRNNVFLEKFVRLMIFCAVIFVGMMLPAAEELLKVKEMTPGYTGKFIWGMFTEKRQLKDILPLKADLPQYPNDHKVEIIRYITCGGIGEMM